MPRIGWKLPPGQRAGSPPPYDELDKIGDTVPLATSTKDKTVPQANGTQMGATHVLVGWKNRVSLSPFTLERDSPHRRFETSTGLLWEQTKGSNTTTKR